MTSVELTFRCASAPSENAMTALAGVREVYGIRKLRFDREAATLLVEYDATRLTEAAVARLVRQAGFQIEAEKPPIQ